MHERLWRSIVVLKIAASVAQVAPATASEAEVEAILVHPPFALTYGCTEHWDGQLPHLGDALGADCTLVTYDARGHGGSERPRHPRNVTPDALDQLVAMIKGA